MGGTALNRRLAFVTASPKPVERFLARRGVEAESTYGSTGNRDVLRQHEAHVVW
jgi:hypothetical protein